MRADRLSVIIPAYNAGDTIERAIRSAFDQDPVPHEVIVADDGSTDNTAEVAELAGATVLRIAKANGSVARNRAVQAATGDLLFFLDADDWWKPGKLAAHLAVWGASDPSFVFDVATKVPSRPHPFTPSPPHSLLGAGPDGDVPWQDFLNWTTWTSGSSFSVPRSRYLELGGFTESLVSQQDVDFWVRCAHVHGPAHRIAESFTCYRLSAGGVSKKPMDVATNLERVLANWPFATHAQKREFHVQMALTAAGFTPFPRSLEYFGLAGWPIWRAKFYRALARSLVSALQ